MQLIWKETGCKYKHAGLHRRDVKSVKQLLITVYVAYMEKWESENTGLNKML